MDTAIVTMVTGVAEAETVAAIAMEVEIATEQEAPTTEEMGADTKRVHCSMHTLNAFLSRT